MPSSTDQLISPLPQTEAGYTAAGSNRFRETDTDVRRTQLGGCFRCLPQEIFFWGFGGISDQVMKD